MDNPVVRALEHRLTDIYVIEWLDRGLEQMTGSDLFREVLVPAVVDHPEFKAHLIAVREPAELLGALKDIEDDVRRGNGRTYPLLHIETHGNETALGRVRGGKITFEDLKPGLIQVNEACRNHLVVTMAACLGEHAIQIMEPWGRAPAVAIVGIDDSLEPELLATCFRKYFDTIIRTRSGDEAIRLMNQPLEGRERKFRIVPAERMFRGVWNNYAQGWCVPTLVQESVERIDAGIPRGPIVRASDPVTRAEKLVRDITDLRPRFEKMRDRFFMIDLDPNNRDRFPVRFEEMEKPEGIL